MSIKTKIAAVALAAASVLVGSQALAASDEYMPGAQEGMLWALLGGIAVASLPSFSVFASNQQSDVPLGVYLAIAAVAPRPRVPDAAGAADRWSVDALDASENRTVIASPMVSWPTESSTIWMSPRGAVDPCLTT